MFRIDGPGATPDNKFSEGDPASGTRATVVTDEWLNAVQEEIANAVENEGYSLDKLNNQQLSGLFLRRPIYVGSVAELEGLSLQAGVNVYLTEDRKFGPFLVKSGTPPSDPLKGIYIGLANGNYAVRQYGQAVITGAAVRPEWFDAVGDGVAVDSQPIYEAWRLRVPGGAIEFDGTSTYLIDASYGTDLGSGRRVLCWADGEDSPKWIGNGCTIKLVNHDFSAGQGIMFSGGTACRSPRVSGFNFDMTFVGINTSASFYPFGGGVWFQDDPTGLKTQNELNRDVDVEDCTFKLFHPSGQYAKSGAAFSGDPNNGYKVFSVFANGDNLATDFDNQNQNITIKNCTVKKGHNGYGFWVWAYNNAVWENPTAEDWVSKHSTSTGAYAGAGTPLIRYHQFYCKGAYVKNIMFRAKPCSERTIAGFEGAGDAVTFSTNLNAAGLDGGPMEILGGYVQGGNGDAANSQADNLISCNGYGVFKCGAGLVVDGIPDSVNAFSSSAVFYRSESNGGTGYGEVHVDVTFGKNASWYNNVLISNGASLAADRRAKVASVTGTSYAQSQHYLDMDGGSTAAFKGVERLILCDIVIDGANSRFAPTSTNSRAFRFVSSPGDQILGNNVSVSNKYYEFNDGGIDADTVFRISDYVSKGTTTRMLGPRAPVLTLDVVGTPESVEVAAVGSTARRSDGGAGTAFYVKETGSGDTGWVAK
jgi:hypothetical protein